MCILPQMASEAKAASKRPQRSLELRFEISNYDYPGIHVRIASNGLRGHDGLRGHGGLQTTSEVMTSDLTSVTLITLVSSEAMVTSK